MAINKAEWDKISATIDEAIRKAIAPPSGLLRVTNWLRTWGAISALWAVPLALVALLLPAIYMAVARTDKQARFETSTTDSLTAINSRLTKIEGQIAKQNVVANAALPAAEFKASLPDLGSALSTLTMQKVSVSASVVSDIQQKLINTDSNATGYWPAVGNLISFRSFNNLSQSQSLNAQVTGLAQGELRDCTDKPPLPMRVTEVINPYSGKLSRGVYENCRFELDSEEDDERLNAILNESTPLITFSHCLIVYGGGPIKLILEWKDRPTTFSLERDSRKYHVSLSDPNTLEFEDCLLEFSLHKVPDPKGQAITTLLLAQNGNTLKLPSS